MTFRTKAAERERDQLGTNTSAGHVLSFVEVSLQPLSISGARQALLKAVKDGPPIIFHVKIIQ